MRTSDYDVQKRRALRKAARMRARVMKAFLRTARAVVAKAAHDASVRFYEAAGVRIRALTQNSLLGGPAAVDQKA